jgi:long-chain acyl-CoA synthetase
MQNFFEQFAWAAERHAGRTAIEVQHKDHLDAFTYGRLREMAERTAAWLAVIGIGAGERCAILADNDAHWCAAYLGVLRRGAIAVPLDTAYKASQVETLLRDSGARVFFTTAKYLDTVRAGRATAGSDCRLVLLHGQAEGTASFEGMIGGHMPAPPLPACPSRLDDPAVILYTSGTTSDPKGVVLTHGNLLAERAGAFEIVRVNEHDTILGVLPLFHALAQMANLLLPFSIGACVVFLETVNTTELLRALAERQVTIFACVPQFFYLIHQRVTTQVARSNPLVRWLFAGMLAFNGATRRIGLNLGAVLFRRLHRVLGGRVRVMVTGGSRFDPAIGADLYRLGFNILQGYGLTETSGAATLTRPNDPALETVGQPLSGNQVRIAPPEAGADAESGADGEVLIGGPIVMQGYFNRPEATAAALRDGWLHTGDLGRLDAQGRLSITGRKKELIVLSSGKNIYPEEIEAVYRKSAFIKELCVLGLARPGEPAAERLYAVVVPDDQVLREKKIANVGDIIRFEMEGASVNLPHHKRVLGYEIWMEPLPRTSTGKLKRFEIERRVKSAADARRDPGGPVLDEADRAFLDRPELAAILEVIRQAAKPGATLTPDANLELDLGLDSMERVELLTALEQKVGADIPDDILQRLYTVRELAESLIAHAKEGAGAGAPASWATLLSAEAADHDVFREWLQPHWLVPAVLFVAIKVVRLLLRPGVKVTIDGVEHFPAKGPYVICPNHQSYLDPFFVMAALPYRLARQMFFVGASEYFETSITRWLARQVNLVPVDPDAALVSAMQAGAAGLREGRILVLFPEGERAIDGTVRNFKKGAAILGHHLPTPLVPVALTGVYEIWPRNRPLNWRALLPGAGSVVRLRVGPPITPSGAATEEATYAASTARLRDAVASMHADLVRASAG